VGARLAHWDGCDCLKGFTSAFTRKQKLFEPPAEAAEILSPVVDRLLRNSH
jgi:hypothetical protein